jgi:Ca-activated chloride channel family protein
VSFESPWLLLALLAVPLAVAGYVALERRRAERSQSWSSPALLPNMIEGRPGRRRYIPAAFFLIGLTFLLVGFARPQATIDVPREGATLVLVVDVSGSMDAQDVKPTRLKAARQSVLEFLEEVPDKYRLSLITFSNRATVRVPPTYDREAIATALPVKARELGTALGDAVDLSVKVALRAVRLTSKDGARSPAAAIIFSDGLQNVRGRVDPAVALAAARKARVPISTVLVGTQRGILRRPVQGGFVEQIQVPTDPAALRTIAQETRGNFFQARTPDALKKVLDELGHQLVQDKKKREISAVATGAAVSFILAGALLSGLWFRRLV